MSTRERWIVYPLLFLTLGIVMRDKLREMVIPPGRVEANEVVAQQIHCNQLQVDQMAAVARVVVRTIQCSELAVAGPNGRPTVILVTDPKNKGGAIETLSSTGVPLVRLLPTDSGGVVVASDFKWVAKAAAPEKPKTPSAPSVPSPKQPSKEPEKAPAKASK